MNFKFSRLKTLSVAAATVAMMVLPPFKIATFLGLTGVATGITLVTSCKSEEPELVKPEPEPNPDEPKPEPQRAEVTIANPGEFAAGAEKIKEFLTAGHDSVYVTMPNNIPVTPEVAGIIDQKIITVGNVVWLGGGAFVPSVTNQEIYGNLYENLPVGMNGDMRFYVPGKNDAHRIKYFINNGLINTDTISTSRFPTGLRAQKEIYVNTDYAVDAQNFSGYEHTNDPAKHIPVIVQDGKQLVLENATVDILDRFQTDVVQGAYNYGLAANENYMWNPFPIKWVNMDFGPNGPLQLLFPNNPLSNPNISWTVNFDQLYDDLVIKSMRIRNGDIIGEAGYSMDGEDKGDAVLNVLEHSRLNHDPIDFTTEGEEIDIRFTQHKWCQMIWGNEKVVYLYLDYLGWLSRDLFELKKHNHIFKVGNEVVIVSPRDTPLFDYRLNNGNSSWTVSQDAPKHMLNDYNIVLDHKPELKIVRLDHLFANMYAGLTPARLRLPGGWGQEWWNLLQQR